MKHDAEWIARKLNDLNYHFGTVTKNLHSSVARAERELMEVREYVEAVSSEFLQGRPFPNHDQAFAEARNIVVRELSNHTVITIKILAVSSSFSWHFYSMVLPALLRSAPLARCELDILLVEPQHLTSSQAGRNSHGEEWADVSGARELGTRRFISAMDPRLRERYRISLGYYRNLPHWHGVLINNSHLLLGRTSWEIVGGAPHLRVGENTYRLFTSPSEQCTERIQLFLNWFDYYSRTGRKVELYPASGEKK